MKNSYVTALTNSILSGLPTEQALLNTKALLKKRGHERLWSQVLRASLRVLEAKLKQSNAQITLANPDSLDKSVISQVLKELGAPSDNYTTVIDSTIIGGFKARSASKLIDKSYKTALLNLYRKITK